MIRRLSPLSTAAATLLLIPLIVGLNPAMTAPLSPPVATHVTGDSAGLLA